MPAFSRVWDLLVARRSSSLCSSPVVPFSLTIHCSLDVLWLCGDRFMAGGDSETFTPELEAWPLAGSVRDAGWASVCTIPQTGELSAIAAMGDRIYCIGGYVFWLRLHDALCT